VLHEQGLSARDRDRLVLVWHARRFAQEQIGLRPGESYRHLVRLNRDAASYVVAAAPPDSLPWNWP
jgi:predicted aminopeptidase